MKTRGIENVYHVKIERCIREKNVDILLSDNYKPVYTTLTECTFTSYYDACKSVIRTLRYLRERNAQFKVSYISHNSGISAMLQISNDDISIWVDIDKEYIYNRYSYLFITEEDFKK